MGSLEKLQIDLFSNELGKTTAQGKKEIKSKSNLKSLETVKKELTIAELSASSPSMVSIDNYDTILGSARLIIQNDNSCSVELSNGNEIKIDGAVDAQDLFNVLYELFGEDNENIRMTLYIHPAAHFPELMTKFDSTFISRMESLVKKDIAIAVDFNSILQKDGKACSGCHCWSACTSGSGSKCSIFTAKCHG